MRYGENSQQKAWLYTDTDAVDAAIAQTEVLHGKPMSYNNYVDGDGALEAVKDLAVDRVFRSSNIPIRVVMQRVKRLRKH